MRDFSSHVLNLLLFHRSIRVTNASHHALRVTLLILLVSNFCQNSRAADGLPPEPADSQPFTYQITGLFCPERVQDLQTLCAEKVPEIEVLNIDYELAEATFQYAPMQIFPDAKPAQWLERFDQLLRQASRSTFGAKARLSLPRDRLTRIEIAIVGLDCKGCSLAVYEYAIKLPGVAQATASFKEGKLTALIDAEQINQAEIEKVLTERRVTLATPQE